MHNETNQGRRENNAENDGYYLAVVSLVQFREMECAPLLSMPTGRSAEGGGREVLARLRRDFWWVLRHVKELCHGDEVFSYCPIRPEGCCDWPAGDADH